MDFFQHTAKLTQMAARNIACDVSRNAAEEATEPIPGLVDQAAKPANEAVDDATIMAEKLGERIPDVAAQTAQDRNYATSIVVLAGAAGIAMVAAPAVFALPALGAVGLSQLSVGLVFRLLPFPLLLGSEPRFHVCTLLNPTPPFT
ncbi:hypothetical protein M0657_011002 [Pyricularia oryzae]|nr:hypothetical protein M9X92_011380 [Pyricularia oryzae]KAI7911369.1 hypothetical protein M0657_011002 [Pyricularia oryzae]